MKRLSLLLTFLLIFFPLLLIGQISRQGIPPSFEYPSLKGAVPVEQMLPVSTQKLLEEDQILDTIKDIPWRFGYNMMVNFNLANSGVWDILPGEDRIWRLGISSPGAYTINLTFDEYRLPPGAELYVYNADRTVLLGAFTDFNNQEDGYFATTLIQGDKVFIEYFEPSGVAFPGKLSLEMVTHAYRDPLAYAKAFGSSGSCNINVSCDDAIGWENQVNSIVMLVSGGNGFCTGALINNTSNDGTPFLLSANHCYSNPGSVVVWFNWQSEDCENPSYSPPYDAMSGAVHRARNSASDFWLMELNQDVPEEYNPYFAGWNRSLDAALSESIYGIHHPSGDIKKFSYSTTGVQASGYLGGAGSGTTHWRIVWSGGTTTEPGSSGSPIFDSNGRIVGQLHGGYAACGNTQPDWYGRLGVSWTGGGSNANRLSHWLDPLGLDVQSWDGYDPFGEVVQAPSAFSAQAQDLNAIELSWQLNENQQPVIIAVNTEDQFGVPSGPYSLGQQITGGGTVIYMGDDQNFLHTELEFSTTYYYKAWSYSSGFTYSDGVTSFAVTPDLQQDNFPPPTDLTAQVTTDNKVELSWQAPDTQTPFPILAGYVIYRNGEIANAVTNPSVTTFLDTGAAIGTSQYYVTAFYLEPQGESFPSNTVEVTIESGSETYSLLISAVGEGLTTPPAGSHVYNEGTVVDLIALALPHWNFSHWEENGQHISDSQTYQVIMDQDHNITAVFIADQHTVTLGSFPDNMGEQSGGGTFSYGQTISISTTIPQGWEFKYWKNNETIVSTSAAASIVVTDDFNLIAYFEPLYYDITLEAVPQQGGTVSGGGNYAAGTEITIEAVAAQGWDFINWKEGNTVISTQADYTFEVNQARELTANFEIQTFQVSAQVQPAGSGTVAGSGTYTYGETASLTAVIYPGWAFTGWESDGEIISTDNPLEFAVYSDVSLAAIMESTQRTLTIALEGEGTTDPLPGTHTYNVGDVVSFSAIPDTDWIFLRWVIDGVEYDSPQLDYEIEDNTSATAYFQDATSDNLQAFDEELEVFPVPASGNLFVGLPLNMGPMVLSLYNLNGQVIRSADYLVSDEKKPVVSFDIAGVKPGIYILKLSQGSKTARQKVIIY